MDLRQLRYFVKVVELRSFTKAAEHLRIAQPSLGLQIRKLEDELQVELLVRHSRGAEPTEVGRRLFEDAREILDRVTQARHRVLEAREPARIKISLGITPTANAILSAALIKRSGADLPELTLNLVEELSSVLAEWVASERLDMALAYQRNPRIGGLVYEQVLQESMYFVGSANIMAPSGDTISFKDVASQPLIIPGEAHGLRQLLDDAVEKGAALNVLAEVQSVSAIKQLVQQGIGYTVLPFGAVRHELDARSFAARRIVEPEISPTLCLIFAERHRMNRAETALRALILELIAEEIAKPDSGWRSPNLAEGAVSHPSKA